MTAIVCFPGRGPLVAPEGLAPVPDVVEVLERALENARKGEIRAIGLAIVKCDANTSTVFACDPDAAVSHYLSAATSYLHARYIAHKLKTSEPA